jgi:hypothetical protein
MLLLCTTPHPVVVNPLFAPCTGSTLIPIMLFTHILLHKKSFSTHRIIPVTRTTSVFIFQQTTLTNSGTMLVRRPRVLSPNQIQACFKPPTNASIHVPPEILETIFNFIDFTDRNPRSLIDVASVCRRSFTPPGSGQLFIYHYQLWRSHHPKTKVATRALRSTWISGLVALGTSH